MITHARAMRGRFSAPGAARLGTLWPLLVAVVAVLIGFHQSLWSLLALAQGNTPVAFVAFLPVVAFFVARDTLLRLERVPAHDYFFDLLFFLILALLTLIVLFVLPVRMAWDYWLVRPDLLVLPLFVAAVLTLLCGVGVTRRLLPALFCLLLAWPIPYEVFAGWANSLFLGLTIASSGLVLHLLPLSITAPAAGHETFHIATATGTATIIIGSTCAGLDGFLGFLVVGGPISLLLRGRRVAKVCWVGTGMLLALLANVVRVVAILVVAALAGIPIALQVVHPALGALLFGGLVLLMLAVHERFGLRFPPPPVAPSAPVIRPWRVAVVLVAALVGVTAVGNQALSRFAWLNPSASVQARLPTPGLPATVGRWQLNQGQSLDWFAQYFGAFSRSYAFDYRTPVGDDVATQVVITTSRGGLDSYTIENCFLFHGEQLLGVTRADLGHGMIGTVVSYRDRNGSEGSALYWTQPVTIAGQQEHQRTLLLLDVADHTAPHAPARVDTPVAWRIGTAVSSFFSPYIGEHQPATHAAAISALEALGRTIIVRMSTGDVRPL